MNRAQARTEALLASGYLTNAVLSLPNQSLTTDEQSNQFEIARRLKSGLGDLDYWQFHMSPTQAWITCRPSDLPFIRRVVANP